MVEVLHQSLENGSVMSRQEPSTQPRFLSSPKMSKKISAVRRWRQFNGKRHSSRGGKIRCRYMQARQRTLRAWLWSINASAGNVKSITQVRSSPEWHQQGRKHAVRSSMSMSMLNMQVKAGRGRSCFSPWRALRISSILLPGAAIMSTPKTCQVPEEGSNVRDE